MENVDKEKYVSFHVVNYQLDFSSAITFLEIKNVKYAVIAGYYAVLNVTLWYFAKYFNLKISEEDTGVHTNCLIVLEKFVGEKQLREKIITLLNDAKKEFVSFTILKKNTEETLPLLLRVSADKRKRYTYYSQTRNLPSGSDQLLEAKNFLESIV
ncbi:hypothetical protein HYX13_00925, partial [Candidatus Woesearchaeota archaeon]|nr:hypothetical protein [Candidatus Woesearchaeota archaeon]